MKSGQIMLLATLSICLCGCDGTSWSSHEAETSRRRAAWAEWEQRQAEEEEKKQAAWQEWKQQQAAENARREEAWAESDTMWEKEKELTKRWEALLDKQEEQAKRYDSILDKWESTLIPSEVEDSNQ